MQFAYITIFHSMTEGRNNILLSRGWAGERRPVEPSVRVSTIEPGAAEYSKAEFGGKGRRVAVDHQRELLRVDFIEE